MDFSEFDDLTLRDFYRAQKNKAGKSSGAEMIKHEHLASLALEEIRKRLEKQ